MSSNILTLLRNRDFSAIFIGGLISDIGSNFAFIAILFLAIDYTDYLPINEAAQAVALIMVVQVIPSLLIGPFAGVIVDRYDRKKIMALADVLGALSSLGALLSTNITHLYLVSISSAITRLFFYPARGASIPRIVEPSQLLQANGITQTMTQLSSLIGPGIAGVVAYKYGLDVAFIIDGASYLVSAVLVLMIRMDLKPVVDKGVVTVRALMTDLKEGLQLVVHDSVIRYILGLFLFLLLGIGMVNPLLAFYLKNTFGLTAQDFGFLVSFSAITGVVSAILITIKGDIKRKLTVVTSASFIVGGSLALLGMAGLVDTPLNIMLLYTSMALIGMINVTINVPLSALFQAIIDDQNLGKVGGFFGTALSFAQVASSSTAALLVIFFPISQLFIIIGIFSALIGVAGLVFMKFTDLERISQSREAEKIKQKEELREQERQARASATEDVLSRI